MTRIKYILIMSLLFFVLVFGGSELMQLLWPVDREAPFFSNPRVIYATVTTLLCIVGVPAWVWLRYYKKSDYPNA